MDTLKKYLKKGFFSSKKVTAESDLELQMDNQKALDLMKSFGVKRLPPINSVNICKIPINKSETL